MIGLANHERVDQALYDDFETDKAREVHIYFYYIELNIAWLISIMIVTNSIKFLLFRKDLPRKLVSKRLKQRMLLLGRKLKRQQLLSPQKVVRPHIIGSLVRCKSIHSFHTVVMAYLSLHFI